MAKSQPEMTWADYLAVGVAPVFIMALVGSLCFFLLDLGYAGEYAGRLRWILFWFVFGSVMLARVSITQGAAHAGMLGMALGLATIVAIASFVNQALVGCLLVGVVWWCAHKLTWNCTFIDDTVDPSAAGLLETAGHDERLAGRRIGTRSAAEKVYNPLAEDSFGGEEAVRLQQSSWWKRAWRSITDLEPKAHAPGLSVLYFSLAALPLFGFGQWLIPAAAADRQASAFRWLAVYLASGLALLLITSFLGLRRYLRRRTLEMPAAMTSAWMGVGATMIVVLLVGAMVLPLPSARHDWAVALRDRVLTSPEREASTIAPLKSDGTESEDPDAARTTEGQSNAESEDSSNGAGEEKGGGGSQGESSNASAGDNGQGKPTDQGGEESGRESGDSQGQDGEKNENSESSGDSSGQDSQSKGDKPADNQQGNQSKRPGGGNSPDQASQSKSPGTQSQSQSGNQSNSPASTPPPSHTPSAPPNPLASLGWLRPLFWIVLAVAALVLAFVFRERMIALLREIAEIWRGLWQIVFPRKVRASDENKTTPKPSFLPFSHFANPFLDGRARKASTDELVKYTFAALEAWAYEQGASHRAEETPLEFTARITATFDSVGNDATRVGGWLARSLYARQTPPREALATLESLWRTMQSNSPRREPAPLATSS